ncbi:hypothetical protein SDC9_83253 [bioreactor metagenome]|uniref:Uncharacterized protein n=1 Tax=bioreactor metagenome TaxID=1076179 RepID=A0A644ZFL8_9ZZZZ
MVVGEAFGVNAPELAEKRYEIPFVSKTQQKKSMISSTLLSAREKYPMF